MKGITMIVMNIALVPFLSVGKGGGFAKCPLM